MVRYYIRDNLLLIPLNKFQVASGRQYFIDGKFICPHCKKECSRYWDLKKHFRICKKALHEKLSKKTKSSYNFDGNTKIGPIHTSFFQSNGSVQTIPD